VRAASPASHYGDATVGPDDEPAHAEPMTLDDMGDICLSDLEEAGDRLSEGQITPDLPGLAAGGFRTGFALGMSCELASRWLQPAQVSRG
jgi:hypothetical protein